MLLNAVEPDSGAVRQLADELSEKYGVAVVPVNCLRMSQQDLLDVLHEILFEFPVRKCPCGCPTGWRS